MAPAFAPPALPQLARSASRARASAARCSAADDNYPAYVRNAAPHIRFDGDRGISFSMERVRAFSEDAGAPPLFAELYAEPDWAARRAAPAGPVAWPAGDGRDVEMGGTAGSFTVGNDREYREAPPGGFFKRSMDG